VNAAGDLPAAEMEQDVADEGGAAGYGQDLPMGAPMAPPIVSAPVPPSAPRYPAPSGYSSNAAPDVYVPPPPPGYERQAPQQIYAPQQTYAPPRQMRSSAGEPMVLNRHAAY
jgi:hypothetical protein